MFLSNLLGNLVPPVILIFFGYSFGLMFRRRMGYCSMIDSYFVAVLTATGLIIIPTILWIIINDSSLYQFFTVYTIIVGCICISSVVKNIQIVRSDLQGIYSMARSMINGDLIQRFAVISLIVFACTVIFYLSIVPINVDALYTYLPTALHFIRFGHVYPYADPPAGPLLYAWAYPVTAGLTNEPFRQIPLLFILCGPLLTFALARRFLSKRFSLIALTLFTFSPFLEVGMYLWSWHVDFIAAAFAGLAIYFLLTPRKHQAILVGLSLSLSILTKAPFGLAATTIVVILLLRSTKRKVIDLIAFLSILLFFLVFGLKYSFSLLSSMSPIYIAVPAGLAVVFVLAISFQRSNKISTSINPLVLLLSMSPVMIWVLRQIALGGTPLSLPIFPNQISAADWWNSLISKLSPQSNLTLSTNSILMILYHPLLGLTLLPPLIVGLIYCLKERRTNILFLIVFTYYFIWLSALSSGATYRHLYPVLFFLFPIVSIGFYQITRYFKIQRPSQLLLVLLFFAFIESTQGFAVYLAETSYLPEGLPKWVLSLLASKPPWLNYEDITQIQPFAWVIALTLLVSFVLPLVLGWHAERNSSTGASKTNRIRNRLGVLLHPHRHTYVKLAITTVGLFLFCSSLMIAPLMYSALVSSGGDLSRFSVIESWYKNQKIGRAHV